MTYASAIADHVCVGTVYELDALPPGVRPVVLTPAPRLPERGVGDAVLTVGSVDDVRALRGWRGEVAVKLASRMRRYGASADQLPAVLDACAAAGLRIHHVSLHLPLAGGDADRHAEAAAWLDLLAGTPSLGDVEMWLSHLGAEAVAALRVAYPGRRVRVRLGTALWHGDKSLLHLAADVIETQPIRAGDTAGYRLVSAPVDGFLIAVGAGSAHGVAALADGRSPLHFGRCRIPLLEPPHMHTTMAVVGDDQPCPQVGDWVDVQRPLISVTVDEVVFA